MPSIKKNWNAKVCLNVNFANVEPIPLVLRIYGFMVLCKKNIPGIKKAESLDPALYKVF